MNAHDLLEALVAIPSVTGDEDEAVAFMQDQARRDGFDVQEDDVGNLIARTRGDGPHIVLLGHIDTVPGGPEAKRDGNILWGRGSVDAKGSLVAAYAAARRCIDDARITVVGAVGEEGDSRGAKAWLAAQAEAPDLVIVGEPSGWDAVTIGYKGIVRGAYRFSCPSAHGGAPGPNATDRLVAAWSAAMVHHEGHGFGELGFRLDHVESRHGDIEEAMARFQVRLPPRVRPGDVVARLQEAIGPCRIDEAIPGFGGSARSPLAALFRGAIRGQGGRPRLLRKTGTADLNLVAGRWPEVPIVAYGPGDSEMDHGPEERLDLADLDRAVAVLEHVIEKATARTARPMAARA